MRRLFSSENIEKYLRSLDHEKPQEDQIIEIVNPWIDFFNDNSLLRFN